MLNSLTSTLAPETLLGALDARYATKIFDADRTIDAALWQTLETSLVLTPSSFGLQPWKFLVITDAALKARLRPHAWDQESITSCSHLVVLFTKNSLDSGDVEKLMTTTAEIRHTEAESLAGYAGMINGYLASHSPQQILEWNKRQVYIALGQFLTVAALLGVDACPIEGFSGPEFDGILQLEGYTATVIAAAGYRSPNDKYADLAKVRYSADEIIEHR